MPWEIHLSECDEEWVVYDVPVGGTRIAHQDRSRQVYQFGMHQLDLIGLKLAVGVQSDRLIIFIDLKDQEPENVTVLIADYREPESYRSLSSLRREQIESVACPAFLSPVGAPGLAVQIKDRPGHYYALKWWNTDLGPYPTPLESPAPSPPSP